MKKLKKGTIDPKIDEFGVKHVSGPPFQVANRNIQSPQSKKPRTTDSDKRGQTLGSRNKKSDSRDGDCKC